VESLIVEKGLTVSSQTQPFRSTGQALVLIRAGMNYLHEIQGRRLAEALRSLGVVVDVRDLSGEVVENYDLCVLSNISEIFFGSGSSGGMTGADSTTSGKESALSAVRRLRPYCRAVACCLLDCTDIASAAAIRRRCQMAGIDTILDLGFRDQSAALAPSARSLYHFIPNGLTPSEQEAVKPERSEEERPIPWVFIGHASVHRVSLVNNLITRVDPRGFVYMPNVGKVAVKDVQQLNQRQYETVLRKSRYHIWFSHHQHFCLESERFRLSLLTGCVPIKVISEDEDRAPSPPFDYLVLRESEAAEKIRQLDFHEIRRRFRADFLAFPSLAGGLAKFLISHSLLPGGQRTIIESQAA
jgi:hypothetical protein